MGNSHIAATPSNLKKTEQYAKQGLYTRLGLTAKVHGVDEEEEEEEDKTDWSQGFDTFIDAQRLMDRYKEEVQDEASTKGLPVCQVGLEIHRTPSDNKYRFFVVLYGKTKADVNEIKAGVNPRKTRLGASILVRIKQ